MRSRLADIKKRIRGRRRRGILCAVPAEFTHEDFVDHRGHHLVDAYRDTILKRAEQPLFLSGRS